MTEQVKLSSLIGDIDLGFDIDAAIESYEEKFSFVSDIVTGIVDSPVNAALVAGPPGIGKTWTIDGILNLRSMDEEKPINYTRISGKITPLAFYNTLMAHSSADSVLFFDDADSVIFNTDSLNLLKAATEKRAQRVVTYNSTKLDDTSFVFEGKILIGTNVRFSQNAHFMAIVDRFHVYDMDISVEEKLAKIFHIAYNTEPDTRDIAIETLKFLASMREQLNEDRLTIRTFVKLKELAQIMPTRWQRFAVISNTYLATKDK